jgi:secreted trypsin-like serine protease
MPTRTATANRLTRLAVTVAVAVATLPMALLPAQAADAAKAKNVRASIVNGYQPHDSQWPWIAAILNKTRAGTDWDRHFCGGTLVSPTVVLTAAHCLSKDGVVTSASSLQVALGKRKLSAPGGEHIDVAAVAVHPSYGTSGHRFDVALLYLRQPSAMTPATLLASDVSIPRGTSATVMGWGALYKGGPSPDDLQAVDLAVWSDSDCAGAGYTAEQRQRHASSYDPQTMICAGDFSSGKISCYGDSGGPVMVVDGSGTWRLIGVVSFDIGECAGYYNPDIYAWVHGPTLQQWVTAGIARAGAYAAPAAPAAPAARPVAAPQVGTACVTTRQARARAAYRLGRARTALRRTGRPAAKRRLGRIVKQRRAALRRADARLSRDC